MSQSKTRIQAKPQGYTSIAQLYDSNPHAYERPSRQTLDDFFKDTRSQGPHNYTRITQLYDLKVIKYFTSTAHLHKGNTSTQG